MITLQLDLEGGKTVFAPGERVEGNASWFFDERVRSLEVRLFWYTDRGGAQETGVAAVEPVKDPGPQGSRSFAFTLPQKPLSYSGRLFDIRWALELVALPSGEAARADLVVSPTGRPLEPPGESRGGADGQG
jgi:hypothetical protein